MPVDVKVQRGVAPRATTSALRRLAKRILTSAMRSESLADAEISVLFSDDAEIRRLNCAYRGADQPTDVLAFPCDDSGTKDFGPLVLGDIVISIPRAQAQAARFRHSLEREITILLLHGFAHLLGLDDSTPQTRKKMKKLESHLLQAVEKQSQSGARKNHE
jgi:probable rRNA maturation factor